jgi:dihydroneopterin aldolase
MGTIILKGMEFFSYHGCFKEERVIGAKFFVDLHVDFDTSRAEMSDRLHDTINYAALYSLVKKEMEIESFLLEHVARRIIDKVREFCPEILSIELRISKINPPVGGKMKEVVFVAHWKS